jgi:hypothetical protein
MDGALEGIFPCVMLERIPASVGHANQMTGIIPDTWHKVGGG